MPLDGGKLICINEFGKRGAEIDAKGTKFTFGYLVNNDCILEDKRAERLHCEILCDPRNRITITNHSVDHPIKVNGLPVGIKQILSNSSEISILDKLFIWEFKTEQNTEIPDTPPNADEINLQDNKMSAYSCPNLRNYRKVNKRLTVHNYAYHIASDEEGNTSSLLDELKDENESADEASVENNILSDIENTPKIIILNSSSTKKTSREENQEKSILDFKHSDILITSFVPRETGVRIEKSFTALYKPIKARTANKLNITADYKRSNDILDYSIPATSQSFNTKHLGSNTSMHLVDLTTPNKLAPASPMPRSLLKNVSHQTHINCATPLSTNSIISISSDGSSQQEKDPPILSSLKTPKTKQDSLMKRVLLTSAKKQTIVQHAANDKLLSVNRSPKTSTPLHGIRKSFGNISTGGYIGKNKMALNRSLASAKSAQLLAKARKTLLSPPNKNHSLQIVTGFANSRISNITKRSLGKRTDKTNRTFTLDEIKTNISTQEKHVEKIEAEDQPDNVSGIENESVLNGNKSLHASIKNTDIPTAEDINILNEPEISAIKADDNYEQTNEVVAESPLESRDQKNEDEDWEIQSTAENLLKEIDNVLSMSKEIRLKRLSAEKSIEGGEEKEGEIDDIKNSNKEVSSTDEVNNLMETQNDIDINEGDTNIDEMSTSHKLEVDEELNANKDLTTDLDVIEALLQSPVTGTSDYLHVDVDVAVKTNENDINSTIQEAETSTITADEEPTVEQAMAQIFNQDESCIDMEGDGEIIVKETQNNSFGVKESTSFSKEDTIYETENVNVLSDSILNTPKVEQSVITENEIHANVANSKDINEVNTSLDQSTEDIMEPLHLSSSDTSLNQIPVEDDVEIPETQMPVGDLNISEDVPVNIDETLNNTSEVSLETSKDTLENIFNNDSANTTIMTEAAPEEEEDEKNTATENNVDFHIDAQNEENGNIVENNSKEISVEKDLFEDDSINNDVMQNNSIVAIPDNVIVPDEIDEKIANISTEVLNSEDNAEIDSPEQKHIKSLFEVNAEEKTENAQTSEIKYDSPTKEDIEYDVKADEMDNEINAEEISEVAEQKSEYDEKIELPNEPQDQLEISHKTNNLDSFEEEVNAELRNNLSMQEHNKKEPQVIDNPENSDINSIQEDKKEEKEAVDDSQKLDINSTQEDINDEQQAIDDTEKVDINSMQEDINEEQQAIDDTEKVDINSMQEDINEEKEAIDNSEKSDINSMQEDINEEQQAIDNSEKSDINSMQEDKKEEKEAVDDSEKVDINSMQEDINEEQQAIDDPEKNDHHIQDDNKDEEAIDNPDKSENNSMQEDNKKAQKALNNAENKDNSLQEHNKEEIVDEIVNAENIDVPSPKEIDNTFGDDSTHINQQNNSSEIEKIKNSFEQAEIRANNEVVDNFDLVDELQNSEFVENSSKEKTSKIEENMSLLNLSINNYEKQTISSSSANIVQSSSESEKEDEQELTPNVNELTSSTPEENHTDDHTVSNVANEGRVNVGNLESEGPNEIIESTKEEVEIDHKSVGESSNEEIVAEVTVEQVHKKVTTQIKTTKTLKNNETEEENVESKKSKGRKARTAKAVTEDVVDEDELPKFRGGRLRNKEVSNIDNSEKLTEKKQPKRKQRKGSEETELEKKEEKVSDIETAVEKSTEKKQPKGKRRKAAEEIELENIEEHVSDIETATEKKPPKGKRRSAAEEIELENKEKKVSDIETVIEKKQPKGKRRGAAEEKEVENKEEKVSDIETVTEKKQPKGKRRKADEEKEVEKIDAKVSDIETATEKKQPKGKQSKDIEKKDENVSDIKTVAEKPLEKKQPKGKQVEQEPKKRAVRTRGRPAVSYMEEEENEEIVAAKKSTVERTTENEESTTDKVKKPTRSTRKRQYTEPVETEAAKKAPKTEDSSNEALEEKTIEPLTKRTARNRKENLTESEEVVENVVGKSKRERKPVAAVQQFMENVRARAATPKRVQQLASTSTPQSSKKILPLSLQSDISAVILEEPRSTRKRGKTPLAEESTKIEEEQPELVKPKRGRPKGATRSNLDTLEVEETTMEDLLKPTRTRNAAPKAEKVKKTEEENETQVAPSSTKSKRGTKRQLSETLENTNVNTVSSSSSTRGRRNVRFEETAAKVATVDAPSQAKRLLRPRK